MHRATFYIVDPSSKQAAQHGFDDYLLFLIHHFATQGAKLYVQCNDQHHAEQIAELLWQQDTQHFIAHNLIGEGPHYGSPVEIGYTGMKPLWNRQIAINLADEATIFARTFTEVIDFVPCDENLKQLARERFKIYRQAGYQVESLTIDHS